MKYFPLFIRSYITKIPHTHTPTHTHNSHSLVNAKTSTSRIIFSRKQAHTISLSHTHLYVRMQVTRGCLHTCVGAFTHHTPFTHDLKYGLEYFLMFVRMLFSKCICTRTKNH